MRKIKKLFFSFLLLCAQKGYKLEPFKSKFKSKPFQQLTRKPFFLNDNNEFSVIENEYDFEHVYKLPFHEKLVIKSLHDDNRSNSGNQQLNDWLIWNGELDTEPNVTRNYNNIITKLKNRGLKLKMKLYYIKK